jgi:ribonucleoside-diphosphate reductase alpha chain
MKKELGLEEQKKNLRERIKFAIKGLRINMNCKDIEKELLRSTFNGIKNKDFKKIIILNSKSLIELDADFAKFSGRILLTYIYEEVLGCDINFGDYNYLKNKHRKLFKKYILHAIKIGILDKNLIKCYDIQLLSKKLDPLSDLNFDFLGIQTLYDRYFLVDRTDLKKSKRIEVPQFFWMRVSMGIFLKEKNNKNKQVIKLYQLLKNRKFCPSTPTLFNSGTVHSQLSSCYIYKIDDNLKSIMFRGIAENAFLSKWAGGLGGSWTAVRGSGSIIKGTNGKSQGVIPFLKLHNDQLVAVNQGGKRRGSGVAYLEIWHNDIIDFLELRKNTGDERRRTHDMHTANWIPDLFMKRMESRKNWTLFRSHEVSDLQSLYGKKFEKKYLEYEKRAKEGKIFGKKIRAIDLWKKMLKMIFETGHPWITFKDPCNIGNTQNHAGFIHSSNLCTEITLNSNSKETAVCNLGSIILDTHQDKNGKLLKEELKNNIKIAVRALDNVIDTNFYPVKSAMRSNLLNRPIGLGIMGLQNFLFKKKVSFASESAIKINDKIMETISYYAIEASSNLAVEKGKYKTYQGSKWSRGIFPNDFSKLLEKERKLKVEMNRDERLDWKKLKKKVLKNGLRNSNILAIAPTATIANIMGTSPCIEPIYKNLYVKSNLSGNFTILNSFLVKSLKKIGIWNKKLLNQLKINNGDIQNIKDIPKEIKKLYITAFSIPYYYIIKAASIRQKWIDQSQSINLFLQESNLKKMSHMYRFAWRSGLKTTYYLRTLGASEIEKSTVEMDFDYENNKQKNCKKEINNPIFSQVCETCQ